MAKAAAANGGWRIAPIHGVFIILALAVTWGAYQSAMLPRRSRCLKGGLWPIRHDDPSDFAIDRHLHYNRRWSAPASACPQGAPSSCYAVDRCRHLDNCLLVRPLCRLGEFYPVLTLQQGNATVSVLGRPYPHEYSNAMMLDFSTARGLKFGSRANLTIRTYFHCAVNMYGREAAFIGLVSPKDNTSALNLNSVIHADEAFALTASPRRPQPCLVPWCHVAVDLATSNLIDGAGHIHPSGAPAEDTGVDDHVDFDASSSTEWVHLVGDSNMRRIFATLCQLCGAGSRLEWARREPNTGGTCICGKQQGVAIHYSIAWLDFAPQFNHTGLDLCAIVEPGALGASVCKKAALTLVSLGSHTAHYTIDDLRASVPRSIDAYRNATGGAMAVALTTAMCIEKIPAKFEHTHGTWELLQRNHYRLMALNEIIVDEAEQRRIPVIDLFAWSLSAGCGHFVDAVHMLQGVYEQFALAIARAWLPGLVGA